MVATLAFDFLIGVGTIRFSGVSLNTALPVIMSTDSWELLMDAVDTGDKDLSIEGDLMISALFTLEIEAKVIGNLTLSGFFGSLVRSFVRRMVVWEL